MEKVIFKRNNTGFSKKLLDEVNIYFTNKSKKGTKILHVKTVTIFTLLISMYVYTLLSGHIILFGVLGFLVALVGFNIMHDASHGSYSDNKKLNALLAFIGADVMGGSSKFWSEKHNHLHHTYTNIVGMDDDIGKTPLFRLAPSHQYKWFHKYQHIYCWFLYMFTTINWFYIDDFIVYTKKRIGTYSFTMSSKEVRLFWIGKSIHLVVFILVPIILLGWKALSGIVLLHGVASLFLALVFQMAHIVQGIEFHSHEEKELDEWYIHEVRTTADFASKSPVWTLLLGGLNYQIEHHLFRHISHIHYPAISKITHRICNEMGILYTSFPTFRSAIYSHYKYLQKMGQRA